MKKIILQTLVFAFLLFGMIYQTKEVPLNAQDETYDVVYFGSRFCQICASLDLTDHAFERMEEQGIRVKKYIIEEDKSYTNLFRNYQFTYDVPQTSASVPIIFVGESYFSGREAINDAIDDGTLLEIIATEQMPDILTAPPSDFSLIYFILLGFVDGVNPCAIAMLLIFISLLGFTKKKRVLLTVSLTFITAIFISYFLFGTFLYQYLNRLQFLSFLVTVVPWIIIGLSHSYSYSICMILSLRCYKNTI